MSSISSNLQAVHERIATAARQASQEVALLAVSKAFGPEALIDAMRAGQRAFGENYLQEALDKMRALEAMAPTLRAQWHFIGPIQSNKTRAIAEHFDWVHAVERGKIAQRLSEARPSALPPLQVCLQINISGEASKSGVPPQEALPLARAVAALPGLRLRGLMAVPEPAAEIERQRLPFRRLRELRDALRADGIAIDTLSMGMSADLDAAILEGATIVRVGTAIFGPRHHEK